MYVADTVSVLRVANTSEKVPVREYFLMLQDESRMSYCFGPYKHREDVPTNVRDLKRLIEEWIGDYLYTTTDLFINGRKVSHDELVAAGAVDDDGW